MSPNVSSCSLVGASPTRPVPFRLWREPIVSLLPLRRILAFGVG